MPILGSGGRKEFFIFHGCSQVPVAAVAGGTHTGRGLVGRPFCPCRVLSRRGTRARSPALISVIRLAPPPARQLGGAVEAKEMQFFASEGEVDRLLASLITSVAPSLQPRTRSADRATRAGGGAAVQAAAITARRAHKAAERGGSRGREGVAGRHQGRPCLQLLPPGAKLGELRRRAGWQRHTLGGGPVHE